MNMHGVMTASDDEETLLRPPFLDRARDWIWGKRWLLGVVFLPIAVTALYLYAIAADQYVSESHFVVRSAQSDLTPSAGIGQLLGITGASSSENNVGMVSDYLQSHDAVAAISHRIDLTTVFRRPEADVLSRMGSNRPTPERLLKFFRGQVQVKFNQESGIATLMVRAFRPQDAYQINQALLSLGEQHVNEMNTRSYEDAVSMARRQLAEAEKGVAQVQGTLTAYRQNHRDIDPENTGGTQIKMVSTLDAALIAARAQLAAMGSLISHSSPQYVAMAARVRAMEDELAGQSARLAGTGTTMATNLGGFEDLKMRQEFAGKRYDAAAANLEKARSDAQRQQLYVVRVVNPNLPEKALYPQRLRILATVSLALLLAYSIGWLIVAGVKEHEA